jgi:hypothetical protein
MEDDPQHAPFVDENADRPMEEAGHPVAIEAADSTEVALTELAPTELAATDVPQEPEESQESQEPQEPPAPPEPDLIVELANAMHAAAARERERIEIAIAERSSARIETLQARAQAEGDEWRSLAREDVERIDEWASAEIERIHQQARRRREERQAALDDYLSQHDGSVEAEIARVAKATAIYRERLDAFFMELDTTTDPAEIARLAGSLPEMPDLDNLPAESAAAPISDDAGNGAEIVATSAEVDAAAEPKAEVEAETTTEAAVPEVEPEATEPLVGVMAPAAPAPVAPITAVVSGTRFSSASPSQEESSDASESFEPVATPAVQPRHRGPIGLLRTITPWSRHDERDTTAASADTIAEDNGH